MEKTYHFKKCQRCNRRFRTNGTRVFSCPDCRPEVNKERNRTYRRENTASTTMTRNGRGSFTIAKKVWKNGHDCAMEMLPDQAGMVSRDEVHTSSDILHATPEKTIAMINRILNGRDTYVG